MLSTNNGLKLRIKGLRTLISTVDEFLQSLSNGLIKLVLHSFLVNKQKEFLNEEKVN